MDETADRSDSPAARPGLLVDRLPWLLRWAVLASLCLLVLTAGAYVLARIAIALAPLCHRARGHALPRRAAGPGDQPAATAPFPARARRARSVCCCCSGVVGRCQRGWSGG